MSSINYKLIEKLETNDLHIYKDGVTILLKLLSNVINEPDNPKFRIIRLENKTIKERLLNLSGMKDLLIEIGFEEKNGQLTLQSNILLAKLKKYREHLDKRLELMSNVASCSKTVVEIKEVKPSAKVYVEKTMREQRPKLKIKPFHERISFPKVINIPSIFLQNLEVISDTVLQYEDENLQKWGMQFIPLETLKEKTLNSLRKIQKLVANGKYTDPEPNYDDLLIYELAEWFKSSFFTWVNSKPCKVCNNENTQPVGTITENGVRIEKYLCCHTVTEFHRYNDIEKLLITRSGRCGEWANCFSFFCRCLKYDTRYIYSTSDHVWTEIYSHNQKRWIHIDPSENVIDSPLMYEHGWNRELSYVFAFANDHVQDVTWRYSNNHKAILKRRTSCTERELLDAFILLNQKRQENCSEQRKRYLKRRTLVELVNLMCEVTPTESEKRGRSSGSLAWRLQRGEQNNNFFVFSLMDKEIENKQLNIRYSCSKNVYERYYSDATKNVSILETYPNWEHCLYMTQDVFRKEEYDWKMVYLARMEDTETAVIQWKFDFSNFQMKIKNISIKIETKAYENGSIEILYLNEKDEKYGSMSDLIGQQAFSVKILMSGGKGNCAWQHTQLFRQQKSAKDYPFEIKINFE